MYVPDLDITAFLALCLVLAAWANARATRIAWADKITANIRAKLIEKLGTGHWLNRMIECPWCVGFWLALPSSALAWFPVMGLRYWWIYPMAWFSVAHAAGRLNGK